MQFSYQKMVLKVKYFIELNFTQDPINSSKNNIKLKVILEEILKTFLRSLFMLFLKVVLTKNQIKTLLIKMI